MNWLLFALVCAAIGAIRYGASRRGCRVGAAFGWRFARPRLRALEAAVTQAVAAQQQEAWQAEWDRAIERLDRLDDRLNDLSLREQALRSVASRTGIDVENTATFQRLAKECQSVKEQRHAAWREARQLTESRLLEELQPAS